MESVRKFRHGWLTKFFNKILVKENSRSMEEELYVLLIFKGKEYVRECVHYRGIKFMKHNLNIIEKT